MKRIQVIGCSGSGEMSAAARAVLDGAVRVAASRRLLELAPESAEKFILDGRLAERIAAFAAAPEEGVVLASGDPLCCGVGGTLRRLLPELELVFYPAPTAFQEFFARLGMAWEEAEFFPLHGRSGGVPFRRLLQAPLAVVYCDAARPARDVARLLVAAHPAAAARPAAFGCDLGQPGELVVRGTLAELAGDDRAARSLSMLALLPGPAGMAPALPLGLADAEYAREKELITHPEVRAVVLAKLALVPGVLWDLGAGSGSVGIEAAGLMPDLAVTALECVASRAEDAAFNAAREGLRNYRVLTGDAAALLAQLDAPDRIFIGGGGRQLLLEAFAALRPGGRLVMTAVTVESAALLATALPEARRELLTMQICRAKPLGKGDSSLWRAENPITIGVFEKA